MFVFHTKPCLFDIGYHVFFYFHYAVKCKHLSQTPAESSGEREVVVGDLDNWNFVTIHYYTLT